MRTLNNIFRFEAACKLYKRYGRGPFSFTEIEGKILDKSLFNTFLLLGILKRVAPQISVYQNGNRIYIGALYVLTCVGYIESRAKKNGTPITPPKNILSIKEKQEELLKKYLAANGTLLKPLVVA